MGKCYSVSQRKSRNLSTYSSPDFDNIEELRNLKQIPNFPINPVSKALIVSALSKNYLFNDLSIEQLEKLMKSIKFCVSEENTYIFHQGTVGTLFYIINSGRVEVFVDSISKGILTQENCFGELALLSDSIRRASAKALCKCSFWVISRKAFHAALKDLFKKNYDQFRKIISESVFFKHFEDSKIDAFSRLAVKGNYKDGEVIVREGVVEKMLFILKKGCVVFRQGNEELLKISNPGEMFGEEMILTGEKSKLWCFASGYTEVISINLLNLQTIFGDNYEDIMLKNVAKIAIMADPHLSFLDKDKVISICLNLSWKRYKDKEVVISRKYKRNSMFFVVCTGCLKTKNSPNNTINSYQVIGLLNINERNLKEQDYYSEGSSIIGQISIQDMNDKLSLDTDKLFECLDRIKLIKKVTLFSHLSFDSIKKLSEHIKLLPILKSCIIFEANDPSKQIFIVKSGSFEIATSNGRSLRVYVKNELFGERCLYELKRTANAKCVEAGDLFVVKKSFLKNLPEFQDLVLEAKRKMYYQRNINLPTMLVFSENILFNGRKSFGLKDPNDGSKYNLIIIPKCELENEFECFKLARERNIMIQIEHRQLIKLVSSNFDKQNVYFITEYVESLSLRELLPVPESLVKSFIIHFALILEYLHEKNIIYREFCTDNILISSKNIPYLYNFQYSKIVESRTYTRVGCPYYRSPEMILGRGYTKATDIWSLGVVLFELVYSKLPFKMTSKDSPVEAYQKIIKVKHGFDPSKVEVLNNLILGMLSPSSTRSDIPSIQRNLWLTNLDKASISTPNLPETTQIYRKALAKSKKFSKTFTASNLMNVINT